MSLDTSHGSQPDTPYDLKTFGNGGGNVITTYTPNSEERSALASRNRAEANNIQADADMKNDGRRWTKFWVRCSYSLYTVAILLIGGLIGFVMGKLT